jgi:hypothetical protein
MERLRTQVRLSASEIFALCQASRAPDIRLSFCADLLENRLSSIVSALSNIVEFKFLDAPVEVGAPACAAAVPVQFVV